ncbi:Triacylglycerol lipase V [Fusarium acuminatum]|uniref:Triacylglycerol lipase V n=1 Tax=Fusarium acuminatum TaxID=5515 RepID=A0ABZ2WZ02_9HYPO
MLSSIIIIFFALLCFGKGISKDRHVEAAPIIDDFPWSSFTEITGLDPLDYLSPPSEDTSETIACTETPGPHRLACPGAIATWFTLVDAEQHINITSGQCRSVVDGTCRTVVCAPRGNISVDREEVTGPMWNPLTMRCVLSGSGGIWQNNGSTLVVEMGYTGEE